MVFPSFQKVPETPGEVGSAMNQAFIAALNPELFVPPNVPTVSTVSNVSLGTIGHCNPGLPGI